MNKKELQAIAKAAARNIKTEATGPDGLQQYPVHISKAKINPDRGILALLITERLEHWG
jgi:hypothetical protein